MYDRTRKSLNRKMIGERRYFNIDLLQSNKAIQTEAHSLVYGHPFEFRSIAGMQVFLLRLTPATISHLHNVDLNLLCGEYKHEVCVTLSLLSPAVRMRSLRIRSIRCLDDKRGSFDRELGPAPWNADMSVADWDILVGRNLVKKTYAQMFPFLASFLRSPERQKSEAAAGSRVAQLLSTIKIFDTALWKGPTSWDVYNRGFGRYYPSQALEDAPWTPARREATREAMGEELERLVMMD